MYIFVQKSVFYYFLGGLSGVGLFYRKHKRSPSHNSLKYGRENSPPDSPLKQKSTPTIMDTEALDMSNCAEVNIYFSDYNPQSFIY